MFELSFVKKYLTPKRKQLSVSLIALLSVVVITLVVWLVVIFLSVTEGIEKNWLQKLTALNAPVRIQPTKEYFSSYYYNVDRFSAASHYMSKTLGQKAKALLSNPYDPEFDESLPANVKAPEYTDTGELKDPVKSVVNALVKMKQSTPGLSFQDIEMSGALLRLDLLRLDKNTLYPSEVQSQLTSVSYLTSFPENNPFLKNLLIEPSIEDLNHLLFLTARSHDEEKFASIASNAKIKKLKTQADLWRLPIDLIPQRTPFAVMAYEHKGEISHILVPTNFSAEMSSTIEKKGDRLFFKGLDGIELPLDAELPLFIQGGLEFNVKEIKGFCQFEVSTMLQNHHLSGIIPWEGLEVCEAQASTVLAQATPHSPLWPFFTSEKKPVLPRTKNEVGILIAKNFRENGVRIGDSGYLAYSTPSLSGGKEVQIPIYISGFYDPGIMAVGNKCILVPPSVTETINASESAFTLDKSEANQFFVWFPKLSDAENIKTALLNELHKTGIDKYWKVETYKEYEFAKDLMQQFQSDKYLFTLIAVIILLVACTNIISLLVLLVSDKKKEIGVLRAMGAKRRSIAAIFALSGASLGFFSCLFGVLLAFFTLKNIDAVVSFLSMLQGHPAFNAQFFGTSLPHEISPRALLFAAITTPLLALIAGLVPAIKAARLNPCETLRSE